MRIALFTLIPLSLSSLLQAQIFVDRSATSGARNGSSWTDAFLTLQDAIDLSLATPGQDILVAEDTYFAGRVAPGVAETFGGSSGRHRVVLLEGGAQLYGGFLGGASGSTNKNSRDGSFANTVISGAVVSENAFHVLVTADGSALLDGFKITKGKANGTSDDERRGGALLDATGSNNTPELRNITFVDNYAELEGGALHIAPGNVDLIIAKCRFVDNYAEAGGAVYLAAGVAVLGNCVFNDNGVDPTTSGVVSATGGAIHARGDSDLDVYGSLFYSNQADEGAVFYFGDYLTPDSNVYPKRWRNCTFASNYGQASAPDVAATMHVDDAAPTNGDNYPHYYENCIFWNPGAAGNQPDVYLGLNVEGYVRYCNWDAVTSLSDGTFLQQVGVVTGNPGFVNASAANYNLASTSHCLNAGDNSYVGLDSADVDEDGNYGEALEIDLRENTRLNGTVDMGALERQ